MICDAEVWADERSSNHYLHTQQQELSQIGRSTYRCRYCTNQLEILWNLQNVVIMCEIKMYTIVEQKFTSLTHPKEHKDKVLNGWRCEKHTQL